MDALRQQKTDTWHWFWGQPQLRPMMESRNLSQRLENAKTFPFEVWNKRSSYCPTGFPYSSVGKESACSAGDPSSILGSGRSLGKGIGNLLQFSWASVVAHLVKNPPAMRDTGVQSLGWEDALVKGKATHSRIVACRIPRTVYSPWDHRVEHNWVTFTFSYLTAIWWTHLFPPATWDK